MHKLGVKGIIPGSWIIRERESQRAAQGESVYILQIHPAAEITELIAYDFYLRLWLRANLFAPFSGED